MEQILQQLITITVGGGVQAVTALLFMVIVAVCIDRKRLIAENKAKAERIDKIIDDYYKASLTVSEALASIKQFIELKLK
jgi:hypothetical protein